MFFVLPVAFRNRLDGSLDPWRYKDYILPLIFYKRLDDVYADELGRVAQALHIPVGQAEALVAADRSLIRFYIPREARWDHVRRTTAGLGELLTDSLRAIARENPKLEGVIDRRDFNATDQGQRVLDDDALSRLIGILDEHRLGLDDVESDILGRAYEYLIRKFAERGSSAGEFFTPAEVGFLIARILDPEPGETVYDPAEGSGGLLIKAQLRLREKVAAALGKPVRELTPGDLGQPLKLCGQEIQPDNVATAKMNAFIHDMDADIRQGNTMKNPLFLNADGSLMRFPKITANPMWNQDIPAEVYENDGFQRFEWGTPPASSADWGWIQHMMASLEPGGRMAVVVDTGAASRGSGNKGRNKERDIRKAFVEEDAVEAVILLPDNLFFNTSAPGIIMVMRKVDAKHPREHAGEILLVNASKLFEKGRPKNVMTDEHIAHIAGGAQRLQSQPQPLREQQRCRAAPAAGGGDCTVARGRGSPRRSRRQARPGAGEVGLPKLAQWQGEGAVIEVPGMVETEFKETEVGRIPVDWGVRILGEIAELNLGRTPKRKENRYWKPGAVPWVAIKDLNNGVVTSTAELISEQAFAEVFKSKTVPAGTLLMSFKLTIGKVGVLGVDALHNEAIVSFISLDRDKVDRDYLFYLLQHIDYDAYLDAYVKGKTLNKRKLTNFPIPLPPLPEQRRIAAVLNAIQEAIAAQEDIIAAAREFKRSLMQRLFTYGPGREPAETKETEIGEIPSHWELVKLGDHATISTGTTPSTKKTEYYEGENAFIKTAEIVNNRIRSATTFVSDKAIKDYNLKIYPPGTIMMAMYGQGKTRGQVSILEIAASTTQNAAAIIPDASIDPVYLWQYLLSQYERLRQSGIEGHISHLNLGYVNTLQIPLPAEKEQFEIADTLSDLDDKIAVEEDRKAALQDLFKSALHQLMTGRIRLLSDEGLPL